MARIDYKKAFDMPPPTKLDITLNQNVQNTRRAHKVYRLYHEKLESGTNNMKKIYIKKCRGRLITGNRRNMDNKRINRTKITRKQNWEE